MKPPLPSTPTFPYKKRQEEERKAEITAGKAPAPLNQKKEMSHGRPRGITLDDLESVEGLDSLDGVDGIKAFDLARYLNSKEAIAAFLSFAFHSGDVERFKEAIKIVYLRHG